MDSKDFIDKALARQQLFLEKIKETQRVEDALPWLDQLAKTRQPVIREFDICKLAGQLYDCVDCSEPRWEIDRWTAEQFINANFHDALLNRQAKRDLLLRAYELFAEEEKSAGRAELSPISPRVINCTCEGGIDEYHNIILTLSLIPKLRDELHSVRLHSLLQKAAVSSDGMDRYLGRMVWDQGYQRIKHQLPRPPYGWVRMG